MFERIADEMRSTLAPLDSADLGPEECLEAATALQRAINMLEGAKLRVTARFGEQRLAEYDAELSSGARHVPCGHDPRDSIGAELGLPLALTRRSGDVLLDQALSLTRLPRSAAALSAGDLDLRRFAVIEHETCHLPAELAALVESRVLPRGTQQTAPRLRRAVRREVLRVSDDRVTEEHRQATVDRGVFLNDGCNGTSDLVVTGPLLQVHRLLTAIRYVASTLAPDPGVTEEQRRFDALSRIADAILDDPDLEGNRFGRPGLVLLAGLGASARPTGRAADEAAENAELAATGAFTDGPDRFPELLGVGHLHPVVAAEAAAHRHTRVVECNPEVVFNCDHTRPYEIPEKLGRNVAAYWRFCAFPGCGIAAHRCDLDHVIPWPDGPTCGCNLVPLCRFHHRLKTFDRWQVSLDIRRRRLTWRSPTGRVCDVTPADDEPAA